MAHKRKDDMDAFDIAARARESMSKLSQKEMEKRRRAVKPVLYPTEADYQTAQVVLNYAHDEGYDTIPGLDGTWRHFQTYGKPSGALIKDAEVQYVDGFSRMMMDEAHVQYAVQKGRRDKLQPSRPRGRTRRHS